MEQVIQINADGSVEGLLHKPGRGVDLREFGRADIRRVTEILWDGDLQLWYVKFLVGRYAGKVLSHAMYATTINDRAQVAAIGNVRAYGDAVFFKEYDDAVDAEIQACNHIRLTEQGAFD